jgi:hypothetical protein
LVSHALFSHSYGICFFDVLQLTELSFCLLDLNVHSIRAMQQFYPGRSGEIAVRPKVSGASSFVADISPKKSAFVQSKDATTSSLSALTDMVECSLGVSFNTHSKDKSSVMCTNNPFALNRANLVFAVENLNQNSARQADLVTLRDAPQVAVDSSEFLNEVSFLNSLATGVYPSSHGIVADEWLNYHGMSSPFRFVGIDFDSADRVNAYQPNSGRLVSNLADVLSERFGRESWIVSVSQREENAKAFALRYPHATSEIVSMKDGFLQSSQGGMHISNKDLLRLFSEDSLLKDSFSKSYSGSFGLKGDTLFVQVHDMDASFDSNSHVNFDRKYAVSKHHFSGR